VAANAQIGFTHPENPGWDHISFCQIIAPGERFAGVSINGSRFDCVHEGETIVAGRPAILPSITGRAWITGTHQHMLAPDDPWPRGYRLSDTWPRP